MHAASGRECGGSKARVGKVLASPFCRTRDTARLAFSRFAISRALLNTISSEHNAAWRRQIRAARALLGRVPAKGSIDVFVTHGSVITDATGEVVEEGETLVVRPRGASRFAVLGRVLPAEWGSLRAPASASALRVREYSVPAGTHPHDVAPASDGTVWYTAQGQARSAGSIRRRERRRRYRSARARRPTVSSSGPMAQRG